MKPHSYSESYPTYDREVEADVHEFMGELLAEHDCFRSQLTELGKLIDRMMRARRNES